MARQPTFCSRDHLVKLMRLARLYILRVPTHSCSFEDGESTSEPTRAKTTPEGVPRPVCSISSIASWCTLVVVKHKVNPIQAQWDNSGDSRTLRQSTEVVPELRQDLSWIENYLQSPRGTYPRLKDLRRDRRTKCGPT